MRLNRTPDPLDRNARNGENDNWEKIEGNIKRIDDTISDLVLESGGDSNLEVVQARGGKPVLNDRLNSIDTQLADEVKERKSGLNRLESIKADKNGTGWANLDTFDEHTRAIIQGIEPGEINAVLGERNVKNHNIDNDSITPRNIKERINLLDLGDVIDDHWLIKSGGEGQVSVLPQAGYAVSGYIPCERGRSYKISSNRPGSPVLLFDGNFEYLRDISGAASDEDHDVFEFTIGHSWENVRYFRINIKKTLVPLKEYIIAEKDDYERARGITVPWIKISNDNLSDGFEFPKKIEHSRFKGKKLLVSGDSITEKNFRASRNWHDYLKEWLEFSSVYNDGKSGTGLVKSFNESQGMLDRIRDWPLDIDIILIMGSMNDGTSGELGDTTEGLPVGDFTDDPGSETVYAAMHKLLQDLIDKYPNVPIGFISSTPRNQLGARGLCWGIDGWFEEYNKAYKEVCAHYSVPFLDLYHQSGLRPWDSNNNATYFSSDRSPLGDGIHPNSLGQEIMAHKIYYFVKQFM